jgi:signal transduction histidine kinase
MGSPLERRRIEGRRLSDGHDTRALRGLLHDLGHEITTLSCLVEAVRQDASLHDDSGYRLELLSLEMSRLIDIINHGLNGDAAGAAEPVAIRELVTQLTALAQHAYPAKVTLVPGPDVAATVNPLVLWRVLSNVMDNAARAAGSAGSVTVAVRQDAEAIIEVTDDGPGFGDGPPGIASLGLLVVTSLLESCGGSVTVDSPPGAGTTVRVRVPAEVAGLARAPARMDR